MKLKMGDIISIKHYSGFEIINSIVLESDNDIIIIKTTNNFSNQNIFVGDPIVLGFPYKTEVYICEGIIQRLNIPGGIADIKIINERKVTDSRLHERFPVSLFAEIKYFKGDNSSLTILIRNISATGIMIQSKEKINLGTIVDIAIFIEGKIINVFAEIVRETIAPNSFEYGLKLLFKDLRSKRLIEKYILYLKQEQLEAIEFLKKS